MILRLNLCVAVCLFIYGSVIGSAHLLSGLYFTEMDFNHEILAYASMDPSDSLVEEWGGDISVVRSGVKTRFKFGKFYGYKDRGFKFISFGSKEKFGPHGYYQVLDTSALFIYYKRVSHVQYKYVIAPYFSFTHAGAKHKLTLKQLRKHVPMQKATIVRIRELRKMGHSLETSVNGMCAINTVMKDVIVKEWISLPPKTVKE